jgi:hypothetical protein
VRYRYLFGQARQPQLALGGSLWRPRPIIAARVYGPGGDRLVDGHLDTGADDTVFSDQVAALLGVDLTQAPEQEIVLAGRPQLLRCRYQRVELRITDGVQETYQWSAVVGFVTIPMRRALFGYAGFLQFFDADFHGADCEVFLKPNWAFQGQRI